MSRDSSDRARRITASVGGSVLGAVAFILTLLNFRADVGRSATALRYAAAFFETQANAIMDGHLWVPDQSMGIEGFELNGHTYMYFGPFPALLRIPILLFTQDFNGEMTVTSMFIAWVVLAVFTGRLMWLARDCLVGADRPVSRWDTVLALVITAGITGGTTLTYDASLPWVYHEVYLWQVALMVAAVYWLTRVALEPTPRSVTWLGLVALMISLTRTTGGWAVCLSVFALAAWLRWGRTSPVPTERQRWSAWVLLAGLLPLVIGIAINWVKFQHLYMFPLEDQVWTAVNAHRREALEVNGGSITGPQFFVPSFMAYLGLPGIRFVSYFPWITLPAQPAAAYGAFIDQSYRTGSVSAFTTVLFVLALAALPVLFRRSQRQPNPAGLRSLRLGALATFLVTGGVMGYGYIAHRYTSEFIPAIALGSIMSLWVWIAPLANRRRALAVPLAAVLAVGVTFSMLTQVAVGFATAAVQGRGEDLVRYIDLQNQWSGGPGSPLSRLITTSDSLPTGGTTDQLHIRGRCDGLYLHTGDAYEPWVTVAERNRTLKIAFPQRIRDAQVELFTLHGEYDREILLQTQMRKQRVRLVIRNETGTFEGQWVSPAPGQTLSAGLKVDAGIGYVEVSSSPGGWVGYVPFQEWNNDWIATIATITTPFDKVTVDPASGVKVTPVEGLEPPVCARLAADNGISLR